jgi:hypothetical protein
MRVRFWDRGIIARIPIASISTCAWPVSTPAISSAPRTGLRTTSSSSMIIRPVRGPASRNYPCPDRKLRPPMFAWQGAAIPSIEFILFDFFCLQNEHVQFAFFWGKLFDSLFCGTKWIMFDLGKNEHCC